ncbi:hypothetical protein KO465_06915 [Candidatus Micrarchaeota archaeon]|nr:hypothetical protein [Candidatus Micrarchaeota archaeon]
MKTKPKGINFYIRYNQDPGKEAKKALYKKAFLPLAAVVLVIILTAGIFTGMALFKKNQIGDMESYVTDPANLQSYSQAKEVTEERDKKAQLYSQLETAFKNSNSYPKATEELMDGITESLSGASLQSSEFDSATGNLIINIRALSVSSIPSVVGEMRQMSQFSAVDYTGYNGEGDSYNAAITCTMKITP